MKKILIAVALLAVVVLGVWAFRTAKNAVTGSVELVEGDVAQSHVVLGPEAKPGEKDGGGKFEELTASLKSSGIATEPGIVVWVKGSGADMKMRQGMIVKDSDFAKARRLKGGLTAMAIPAQRGWVPAGGPEKGRMMAAMAGVRFTSSAMQKAQALGWNSFFIVSRMDGGSTSSALVAAPK